MLSGSWVLIRVQTVWQTESMILTGNQQACKYTFKNGALWYCQETYFVHLSHTQWNTLEPELLTLYSDCAMDYKINVSWLDFWQQEGLLQFLDRHWGLYSLLLSGNWGLFLQGKNRQGTNLTIYCQGYKCMKLSPHFPICLYGMVFN